MREAIMTWLRGPPLVPSPWYEKFHTPYEKGDPRCSEGYCYDSMRVFLLSFVVFLLMEVASAVVLSRLSATYRSATLGMKMWLCSSVVSTLHALIATYGSFWLLFKEGGTVVGMDPRQEFYNVMSAGYMLVDLLLVLTGATFSSRFRDPGIILHHLLGLVGLYYISSRPAAWHASLWLATEFSTPFVNALLLLRTFGYKETLAYKVTGILLVAVFFAVRVVLVAYYWHVVATNYTTISTALPPFDMVALLGTCVATTLLNLTWFVKMVKGLLKTLWPSKGRDGAADTASKKTQ